MIFYKSALTDRIFENLSEQEGDIITTIAGESVGSTEFTQDIYIQAKALKNIGVQYGNRIVFLHRDSIFFVKSIIASFLCGATVVLLDPEMGQEMLREKIRSTGISHIFIEGRVYDFFRISGFDFSLYGSECIIVGWSLFGSNLKKFHSLEKETLLNDVKYKGLDDIHESIIAFTGGTTGNPKGVVHTIASLIASANKIDGLLKNPSIFYADMPHFLLLGLLIGVKVIAGKPNISSKKFLKVLSKYQVDTYFSPPYKYNYFIENNIQLPKVLTNILLGSAPIYIGFLKKLIKITHANQKITCVYGMTEILPIAFIDGRVKAGVEVSGDVLGEFIGGIDYIVIDDELLVSGEHQCKQYLGFPGEKYIHTGDLVEVIDNKLIMIGRKKDMIIRKEYNIYPSLYEPIISQIPGISDCALIGIYDEKLNDEKIILFIECDGLHGVMDKEKFFQMLKTGKYSIDTYALPDKIHFTKLPRIGRQNKIDKSALKKLLSNDAL